MLDLSTYRAIRDNDFTLIPALDLRSFSWGSTQVYDEMVKDRMRHYCSKYDLLHWLKFWTERQQLVSPFKGISAYEEIKAMSADRHASILKRIFSTYKETDNDAHNGYDIWNAIDAHIIFEHCEKIDNILDFGSGYSRLGLVFGGHERVRNYIAIDCIELSYMLQNLALSYFAPEKFFEYIEFAFERKDFTLQLNSGKHIYHLPTWKWDLIPSNSVDLVCAVFVLPEINTFAFNDFIEQISRTIRPNGYLYLRDHLYHTGENNHLGGHQYDTEKVLLDKSFKKIYQGEYKDNVEIYGSPRIYQLNQ
jgi:SAM-dependent methyltransferase